MTFLSFYHDNPPRKTVGGPGSAGAYLNDLLINTIVQHHVCRIFQDAAKMLGISVIHIPNVDSERLTRAAAELEEILASYVQHNAPTKR